MESDQARACAVIAWMTAKSLGRKLDNLRSELQRANHELPFAPGEVATNVQRMLNDSEPPKRTLRQLAEASGDPDALDISSEFASIVEGLYKQVLAPCLDPGARLEAWIRDSVVEASERCSRLAALEPTTEVLPVPPLQVKRMSVVSVDMSQYGKKAATLDAITKSPKVLFGFNEQIYAEVQAILVRLGVAKTPFLSSGDGALIYLESAEKADDFGMEIQQYAESVRSTSQREFESHFRVGVCTGDVAFRHGTYRGFVAAGMAIIGAVRIEAASQTGQVWICNRTYDALPADRRKPYSPAFEVQGKPHEGGLRVHSRRIIDSAPWEQNRHLRKKRK